jgi:hypothetical protein
MTKIVLTIILMVFLSLFLFSQGENINPRHTISGFVRDSLTGESLIGATITIKEMTATGTVTNAYGFYSLTIPEGSYTLTAKLVGYEPKSTQLKLQRNAKANFELTEKALEQQEVVVTGEKENENITSTQMGVQQLDVKGLQRIPVLMGEQDVLKTIQLLPGIEPVSEGNSGFYVRGGGSDENLILLDEATVYNASHLLGFFSVFNSDAIKDATLYKDAMPAEFGGRLSSVLDIRMNDGDNKKYDVSGGIGLIASRLNIDGPLINDNGSFSISARRTYADLFLKLSRDTTINQSRLYFYDLNAKANYQLGESDRLYLSGYFGQDVLGLGNTFGIDWGNATGTFRWNHLFNDKLFSNLSLIYSTYDYNVNVNLAGNNLALVSRIQDYSLKQDFEYYFDASNEFKFGLNSIYHSVIPGTVTESNGSSVSTSSLTNKYSWENAFYASDEFKPSPIVSFDYGFRYTIFTVLGPGEFFTYDANGQTLDTLTYGSGKFIKTYMNLEPRLAVKYMLDEESSLKASYGRSTQNMHLISNSNASNPTDLWIPNSNNVKPEIADQVSLGYFRNFENNNYEFSVEPYFKYLQNQIDYRDGAQLVFNENVESQLLYGHRRAYGIEFFLKKKYGRLNGWVGYTLSRSERQFAGINDGNYYPATQDRTHDISIVGMYQESKAWNFSATWVYYTGNAVTFPSGKYEFAGQVLDYYTERNGYRMPAYHRLDLGATWQGDKSSWTFSLYNAYGRENAYAITFQVDPNDPTRTEALQTSLFRFVPSVTYNFRF